MPFQRQDEVELIKEALIAAVRYLIQNTKTTAMHM